MDAADLHVTGGAGGIDANYEDLATLARDSDGVATGLAGISAECHAALADPDLLASAVLDPAGAARFEATLLGALDGRHGLTGLAAGFGERALVLRAVSAAYQAVDAAQRRTLDAIRWGAGYGFAVTLPFDIGLLGVAGGAVGLYTLAGGKIDWPRLLTDHPGLVDDLVGAGPGLVSALPGAPMVNDVTGAAHLVGLFYPDGTPRVTDVGDDPAVTGPPHGFGDLLDGVRYRDDRCPPGADQIDVRVVTHADGSRAYLVDIPGTRTWDAPGQHPELNDLGTNVHMLAGDTGTREEAIAEALRRAGAGPSDPVMLVGHSQGGMVAAQAAHDTGTAAFPFTVTHVVTAGSPVGRVDIPPGVQVLSLENAHDIVPHLDAAANPDRPNRTTVTFDSRYGTVGDNHGLGRSYLPAAQALDRSTDPSVVAYRDSARAFLSTPGDGTTVRAHVYGLTRG